MALSPLGFGADALPLGLVADVLFAEGGTNPELVAAAVRLERFMSGRRFDEDGGRDGPRLPAGWSATSGDETALPFLARADQLIESSMLPRTPV